MKKLFLDVETYSCTDLKKSGARRYAVDSSTMITTACWKWAGEATVYSTCNVWGLEHLGSHTVADFVAAVKAADKIVAHNIAFDSAVIFGSFGPCGMSLEKEDCTMARAQRASLPGGLDELCNALQLPGKSFDGHRIVMATCRPRKDGTPNRDPALFRQLLAYNVQDVHCLESVDRMLPPLPPEELEIYRRTRRKNALGLPLDLELCQRIAAKRAEIELEIANDLRETTGGSVTAVTQRARILDWLKSQNVNIPNTQRATIESWLDIEDMPFDAWRVLTILFESGGSAPTKAQALLDRQVAGRYQDATRYFGARSGRGTSEGVNFFNIARPSGKHDPLRVIERLKARPDGRFSNTELSDVLRGAIVAPATMKLLDCDLSNIELRLSLWLANDMEKLTLLRSGQDLYAATAGAALSIPDLTKHSHPKERQCLGADTQVLTKAGWKRIVTIQQGDMVWDGTSWVNHHGLLKQGTKQVTRLLGVEVTEDHLFLCGLTWRPAQDLAPSGELQRLALARGLENLPLRATWWALRAAVSSVFSFAATAALQSTACEKKTSLVAALLRAGVARAQKPAQLTRVFMGSLKLVATVNWCAVCTVAWPQYTTAATTRKTQILLTTAAEASKCGTAGLSAALMTGVPLLKSACVTRKAAALVKGAKKLLLAKFFLCGTSQHLKAATTRISSLIASKTVKATNRATFALLRGLKTCKTGAQSKACSTSSTEVFDLLNCGPRHRFMILSSDGPLLVHNCFKKVVLMGGYACGENKLYNSMKTDKDLPYELRKELTRAQVGALHAGYRDANWHLQRLWKELGAAVRAALYNRGAVVPAAGGKVTFHWRRDVDVLDFQLPSGRTIPHYKPHFSEEGEMMFWRAKYGRMMEQKMYGGSITEILCQSMARDVIVGVEHAIETELPDVMLMLEIYDSIVALAPAAVAEQRKDQILQIMRRNPDWSEGLPLDGEGTITDRMEK